MGDASLPPACDGDDGDVHVIETLYSRTIKDEERCAMDAPLPPYDAVDDEEKTARKRTTRARLLLAIGLVFEVSATLLAFLQAVSAGALNGYTDCDTPRVEAVVYIGSLIVDSCDGPIDADVFYNSTDDWSTDVSDDSKTFDGEELVVCDSLTDVPTGEDSFEAGCTCDLHGEYDNTPCWWVALSVDGLCLPHGLSTNIGDGAIAGLSSPYTLLDCLSRNPSGTVDLTITALVVALSGQLVEAFVGFKYWKSTTNKTAPTLAASMFEALGVVIVSSVLLSLPRFYRVSDQTTKRLPVVFWLAWTVVTSVIVGALAEITAECSDRAMGLLPYLRAVGNGLIWLGAALLEVVVTSYLLWEGANDKKRCRYSARVCQSVGLGADGSGGDVDCPRFVGESQVFEGVREKPRAASEEDHFYAFQMMVY